MSPRACLLFIIIMFSVTPLASGHAETITITIERLVYLPADVVAKVGDKIQWVNRDIVAHTATARNSNWDVTIAANKSAELVFSKVGVVDYYCRFHPNMRARISISAE